MSDDWKEMGEAIRAGAKDRREAQEPERMKYAERRLLGIGCTVKPGPDGFRSFTITFPNGRRYNFWPYSGWFAGKPSGRGLAELIKAGTKQ